MNTLTKKRILRRALKDSIKHWNLNIESLKNIKKLDKDWFSKNCTSGTCSLCKEFDCPDCVLQEFPKVAVSLCCKEWRDMGFYYYNNTVWRRPGKKPELIKLATAMRDRLKRELKKLDKKHGK